MRRERFVFAKRNSNRFAIKIARLLVGPEIRGEVAALLEILIAGRAFLAVPALLVCDLDRRENRKPFDGEGDVGQVGDRAVAVLEIKSVEKLFCLLLLISFSDSFIDSEEREYLAMA